MRKIILVLFAIGCFRQAGAAVPSTDRFGLGLMVGSIIAVTGKYWLSEREALDFGAGFISQPWTVAYVDYLFHIPGLFGKGTKFGRETSGYFGGGGGLGFWSQSDQCGRWGCGWDSRRTGSGTGVFMRAMFGLEWYPKLTQFGVFAEVGPSLLILPSSGGTLDIGVGGRYYF